MSCKCIFPEHFLCTPCTCCAYLLHP
jgi:hypothetical protein